MNPKSRNRICGCHRQESHFATVIRTQTAGTAICGCHTKHKDRNRISRPSYKPHRMESHVAPLTKKDITRKRSMTTSMQHTPAHTDPTRKHCTCSTHRYRTELNDTDSNEESPATKISCRRTCIEKEAFTSDTHREKPDKYHGSTTQWTRNNARKQRFNVRGVTYSDKDNTIGLLSITKRTLA